jgi:4-amino-4-deoxy-L-arabinose transferase-like glycosyltransferase
MKNKTWLWTSLVGAFIVLTTLSYLQPLLLWDENAYLGNARSHLSDANYTEDFRYPLLEFIITAVWSMTGESIFAARFVLVLFYLATIYLFFLITQKQVKQSGLLTLLFSFSSILIFWGFRIYTDVLVLFFILLSFHLLQKQRSRYVFFAGIATGLAFLTRFTAIILVGAIVINYLLKKDIKNTAFFLLGCLLSISPWLIFNYATYGDPLWDFKGYQDIVSRYNAFMSPLLFIEQIIATTHIFFIGLLFQIKKAWRDSNQRLMLIYIILHIAYIGFVSDVKSDRYVISILPFIYILGWSFITNIQRSTARKVAITMTGIFTFLLLSIALVQIQYQFSCDKGGSIAQSIDYLSSQQDIDVLSNVWPWFGYYNNFRVHSLYTTNIDELLQTHHPKYFIYVEGFADPFDKNILDSRLTLEKKFVGTCKNTAYIYSV